MTRRVGLRTDSNPIDATERRRMGREYLARRNQEMLDRQRRSIPVTDGSEITEKPAVSANDNVLDEASSPVKKSFNGRTQSISSFDDMVNSDGTLKAADDEKALLPDLPSPPTAEPKSPGRALLETEISDNAQDSSPRGPALNGFMSGMRFANPFGDEFEFHDRSATPKPPVPPKVALDTDERSSTPTVPGAYSGSPAETRADSPGLDDLSFEEQLARALSLSSAESEAQARAFREQQEEQDPDLAQAILASLRHAEEEARRASDRNTLRNPHVEHVDAPLVDISTETSPMTPITPAGNAATGLHRDMMGLEHGFAMHPCRALSVASDDLYCVSPRPLAAQPTLLSEEVALTLAGTGVSADVRSPSLQSSATWETGNHSETFSITPPLVDRPRELINIGEETDLDTASRAESVGFQTDSDADEFASMSGAESVSLSGRRSVAPSEGSVIEVEDIDMESVDSDDDDDGIRTPGSWTDVGSDVGESERSSSEAGDVVRV